MAGKIKRIVINQLREELERLLAETDELVRKADTAESQEEAKHWLRRAHDAQRRERLEQAKQFIERNEDTLLPYFADGSDVDPERIDPIVTPVMTQQHADLWTYASLTWSVPVSQGYGRRTKFIVRDRQNDKVIAIFALGDPVIGLGARDQEIGWTTEQRHRRLYNVYDAFVLGAVEPYRQLLAGKLVALLAISNETRTYLTNKYTGTSTVIKGATKNPTPVLVTTSSALGKSSVYNRLTYRGQKAFHPVGYTSGFGHFHISEEMFQQLVLLTQASGKEQDGSFGKGANYRFRVIRNALTALNLPADGLRHGVKREVYLAPVASNWKQYLRGETEEIIPINMPTDDIAEYFRQRWAIPRSTRRHEFRNWRKENMRLSNELPNANIQYSLATAFDTAKLVPATSTSTWEVSDVTVSQSSSTTRRTGITTSGENCDGLSRDTEITLGKFNLTLTETTWDNGERDIQATDRHDSPAKVDSLIRRLRIGIYNSPLHDQLSFMELRLARPGANGRATLSKTSPADIENLLGKTIDELIPRSMGIIVGTRAELFRDGSRRRNELCAAFPKSDAQTPVRIWIVTRLLSYLASPNTKSRTVKAVKAKRPRTHGKTPSSKSKSTARKRAASPKATRKSKTRRKTR